MVNPRVFREVRDAPPSLRNETAVRLRLLLHKQIMINHNSAVANVWFALKWTQAGYSVTVIVSIHRS